MDDAGAVRVIECTEHLGYQIGCTLGRKRTTPLRQMLQGLAFHKLHHHQEIGIGAMNLVNGRDIRVVESSEGRRFSLKMRHELTVTKLRIEHLDGDIAIERLVSRPVHSSQSAPAELLDESVFPDGFSDHAASVKISAGTAQER